MDGASTTTGQFNLPSKPPEQVCQIESACFLPPTYLLGRYELLIVLPPGGRMENSSFSSDSTGSCANIPTRPKRAHVVAPQQTPKSRAPMVPWATLAFVGIHTALFIHPLCPPGSACLSVQTVWDQGQWWRLLLAPFHHLGPFHLGTNLLALGWLGQGLEGAVGSLRAGAVLLALALLGGLLHLVLNAILAAATREQGFRQHCAVGFSGVLFSLKVMGHPGGPIPVATSAEGFALVIQWLCLLECLALAVLIPRSSMTGHISGILAGLAFSTVPAFYLGTG